MSPTPRRAGARWLDGDCPAAVPAIFDNGARAVSAPEFRILIALPGNRGRAYMGLHRDADGNVIGINLQRPGLGMAKTYLRADADALITELRKYLPSAASIYLKAEGKH